MAREYKVYKIKITTSFDDNPVDSEGETTCFYSFRTNARKGHIKSNFIKAIKSAVKEWIKDDPNNAEQVATDYGCFNHREDYDKVKDFVLDNISTRAFEQIPETYLAKHGIVEVNPPDLELDFDECDNMLDS